MPHPRMPALITQALITGGAFHYLLSASEDRGDTMTRIYSNDSSIRYKLGQTADSNRHLHHYHTVTPDSCSSLYRIPPA
ncbi:unnamed protein product [Nezara viridula]|uniref:Uncharacterized protein n=1 Tax=Nezara viridula TaxID=85310 RepID=A0A9P0E5E0_NEZVI|nr:unnamed protein product [Nezara viridula]